MNGLLKFITCGSVDDGKSTLIGHILYDSKLLYADQEKALLLDSTARKPLTKSPHKLRSLPMSLNWSRYKSFP